MVQIYSQITYSERYRIARYKQKELALRYLTKEWYMLMQIWGIGNTFKKIPDKYYSDQDIQQLYDKALKKEIVSDRREARESGEEYNQAETVKLFRECFKAGLRNADNFYPQWLSKETDKRLIALNLLPETVYEKYKVYVREAKKEWTRLTKEDKKTSAKQYIPEDITSLFNIHDACLLSMRRMGKDLILDFQIDGTWSDAEIPYRTIIFKDCRILEKDPGINTRKKYNEYGIWTKTSFLYRELYNSENGYEIHIMFWAGDDLAYLTVDCSDVIGIDSKQYRVK